MLQRGIFTGEIVLKSPNGSYSIHIQTLYIMYGRSSATISYNGLDLLSLIFILANHTAWSVNV